MPIHRQTLRRLVSWVLRESVCARTEHMFFEGNRIDAFREMICSETEEEREAALDKILPEQQGDFEKLMRLLKATR